MQPNAPNATILAGVGQEWCGLRGVVCLADQRRNAPRGRQRMQSPNHLIKSSVVMAYFGYTNRASFWHFVKTKGVPCITP
jgi:hypothetical protein